MLKLQEVGSHFPLGTFTLHQKCKKQKQNHAILKRCSELHCQHGTEI